MGTMFEAWGEEGFKAHVEGMQKKYRRRCRTMVLAARKHLGDKVAFVPAKGARSQ